MNEALNMQVSAFVDGELPDNEAELLLRRLSQDADLREQVALFLRIGRLMRQDREPQGMDSLRARIAAEIGQTLAVDGEAPHEVGSRLMTPTTGIAVAALVAAVSLVWLSQLTVPVATERRADAAVAIDSAPLYTEPTPAQALANQPSERLRDMLRRHGDSSPEPGSGDILYRMATFELREGELVEIEPDPHIVSESPTDDEGNGANLQSNQP